MDILFNAGHDALRILVAYLLALPVGWYREKEAHSIGVRTFPLVAVASCGYVLLGTGPQMTGDSQARIIQGLVAGIVAAALAVQRRWPSWSGRLVTAVSTSRTTKPAPKPVVGVAKDLYHKLLCLHITCVRILSHRTQGPP